MEDLKPFIAKAADGESLTADEARRAFNVVMSGNATPSQIGGFLLALRVRGETIDEIVGAVTVMREKMTRVDAPENAIDIVGTGGDNSGSYNVSTCAAIIAAGAGATIAKHGNRSLSSKSGSAEALAELGLNLEASPQTIARCIREGGLGFMFAPMHHAAMRHVGPSRVELGTRTIFNLLGPLSSPAGVRRQIVGVFSPEWVEPLAHVLKALGSEHVWVVHGAGLDELTTAGETKIAELSNGSVKTFTLEPEDVGLERVTIDQLKGGDPAHNAAALREVLGGARNPYRDIACLNAAAGLVVAGLAADLAEGIAKAEASLDEGHARTVIEKVARLSQEKPS
ncbi:anthranilate phosphoribosyltransferase [Oricola cellulosilytica]|uniref:Anthranilate phosphoribosyltransferase n=1 Tax=Oricola cellulosilytica TaxID=1429082 RepID=A0A4R0PAH3_9HYPH|nr:anthranilate phosphoribosyltransferase [Oricola cellulosilytica]TCD13252.1 anthranilate phosphoribosyltransferase [Oricola cellulosilytica]